MKKSRILFEDKETLIAYVAEIVLYMRFKQWESPERFYDLIEEWIDAFHNGNLRDPDQKP